MENRANYAIVGLFTLAVIGAAFAFVYWFKRAGEAGDRKAYRIVFVGSVSGLSRGSAVRFNGLRVGEVTAIEIMQGDPGKVVATIEVDSTTPMKVDTKARLESQGLTGVASVQLTGGNGRAADLVAPDAFAKPTLYADRSDYQDVLETVQRLSAKIDTVLGRADHLLGETEGSLIATVKNAEAFSKALSDNSSGVASFLANVGDMSQKVGTLSTRLERFVDGAESLMRAVDAPTINRAVNNLATFSDALGENRTTVSDLIKDTANLAKALNASAGKLDSTLEDVSRITRAIDAEKLNRTLDGAEKFASALSRNADQVDRTVKDITDITEKVSRAASKLDNVMAGAETFFGAGENGQTTGMLTEITEAARAIRLLAANLDRRTAEITTGLNRFSGPGLRDIEALAAESRKAVGDLSRAVRSLERNPSQLLFGGQPAIPEYRR